MLIFLVSVVFTQVQFNEFNQQERDELAEDNASANYITALATWNQARVAHTACLETVVRSDGNRAWKIWLLDFLAQDLFPESSEADRLQAEGLVKLDELLPARTVEDCEDPGPPPVAPGEEEGG